MKINERLKQLRQEKNLTQREMAKMLGVSTSTLQKLEYGEMKIKNEMILKISKTLDITLNDFLKKTNISNEDKESLNIEKDIFDYEDDLIKTNIENINIILDNASVDITTSQKFLLYFLANNKNIYFNIPKDKTTLEIGIEPIQEENFLFWGPTLIKIKDLNIILEIMEKNIQLLFSSLISLNNQQLQEKAFRNDTEE